MAFNIESIFLPSVGVDLVLNMDSLMPIPLSSIIYDTDPSQKTITIARPRSSFGQATEFDQLHLTTIIQSPKRKIRVGIACTPVKFIKEYKLAGNATTRAIILQYKPPAVETNIRSAYRLYLDARHTCRAKIMYNQNDYLSPRDFKIRDISLTGLGLIIPKKVNKGHNSMAKAAFHDNLLVGMSLIDTSKEQPQGTFVLKTRITRLNPKYSETNILAGLLITKIAKGKESILSDFIHSAQIHQLNRFKSQPLG